MRNHIALVTTVLLLSVSARGEATDPAADFFVDISDLAGESCGIRIKTERMYWQLPAEQLRKGYGIGLFSILRNTTNNCEARIYVEVESLGSSDLDSAVDKAVQDLPGLLEAHQAKIEGGVSRDKKAEYRIGKAKVEGCKVRYSVKVLNADPVTVDPTTALMFRHKGAFVTISVENYASSTVDHFSRFLKTLSIEKVPAKADWRMKLVDATGGTYRYFDMPLLPGMIPERSDQIEGNAIGFCRWQDGKPLTRIRIAKSDMDKPMEEKEEAEYRHSALLDMYKNVSPLEEVQVGGQKAWLCSGLDDSVTPARRLAVLYFRPQGLMWTWTFESIDADEKRFQQELAAFKGVTKKLEYWIATPR